MRFLFKLVFWFSIEPKNNDFTSFEQFKRFGRLIKLRFFSKYSKQKNCYGIELILIYQISSFLMSPNLLNSSN